MNFAEIVMLRGLRENTCEAWWNTELDGIVKVCTAGLVNPIGATSLMLPPMYCEWLRMLKKRPSNRTLYFSVIETLLAIVASMLLVGFMRSVLRPAVESVPLGAVTYPAAGLLIRKPTTAPALFFRAVVPLPISGLASALKEAGAAPQT